jgi:hypothetical protein
MKSQDYNDPPFERQLSEQLELAGEWLRRGLPKLAPIAAIVIAAL